MNMPITSVGFVVIQFLMNEWAKDLNSKGQEEKRSYQVELYLCICVVA